MITPAEKKSKAKGRLFVKSTLGGNGRALVASCLTVKAIVDLLSASYKGTQNIHSLNSDLKNLHWGLSTAEQFITKLNEIKTKMFRITKIDETAVCAQDHHRDAKFVANHEGAVSTHDTDH